MFVIKYLSPDVVRVSDNVIAVFIQCPDDSSIVVQQVVGIEVEILVCVHFLSINIYLLTSIFLVENLGMEYCP